MISILSKPFINSCEVNQDSCILIVHFKSKKCGFINIYREQIIFQFSCGWNNIGKGALNIGEVSFNYENGQLLIYKISNHKKILALKCDENVYRIAFDFISGTK
ncbi:hypothetical protein [Sphingobacterium sp. ML3W]|uniref:hypothetical protein n=1 Tax=Sphingobacterium sp. ML3W TaxID=1538644 RepID=UPI001184735A|nr:hypothetical protein [Sphingobacterium sp. ML3W]